jgi:hypothetical protein
MRRIVVVASMLVAAELAPSVTLPAAATPWPIVASPTVSSSAVDKIGWRRYCRRYGCGPDIVAPDVQVDADVAAGDADVSVEADVPAVVVLPPPRPLSCGEYRYWNGTACVDARYNNPYIGPR